MSFVYAWPLQSILHRFYAFRICPPQFDPSVFFFNIRIQPCDRSCMESRYAVLNSFGPYRMDRDGRTMDELCQYAHGDARLQKHQAFLQEYARRVPDWKSLLLYHGLGSGKTITSIVMAETYLRQYPTGIVRVILPARLRTNFTDELYSPLALEHILSREDWAAYHAASTNSATKRDIGRRVRDHVAKKYDIMSLEGFVLRAMRNGARVRGGLRKWCESFTRNALLIVDEAHNVMSGGFRPLALETMREEDRIFKTEGLQAALMMLVSEFSHATSKLLCLTGTPIFDNLRQLEHVVRGLLPRALPSVPQPTVKDWVELLRGRVSYFPGSSPRAYPTTETVTHDVVASRVQGGFLKSLSENGDPFLANGRQLCLAVSVQPRFSISDVVSNLPMHAPKIHRLLEELDQPGKHVVYSSFIERGLKVIQRALERRGWVSFDRIRSRSRVSYDPTRVFVVWDGETKDADKREWKRAFNHPSNIDGSRIRLVLGSPSIREGVTFKHVQHVHIVDPVWNTSTMDQIKGRAVRYCSHVDVPADHPVLRRHVTIHQYKLVASNSHGILDNMTTDQILYDRILVEKERRIRRGERALKNVAMDRYLFGPLHESPPKTPRNTRPSLSPVSFVGTHSPLQRKPTVQPPSKTCPKRRRPDDRGRCPPGQTARRNRHGVMCCYKTSRQERVRSPIPATGNVPGPSGTRRPVQPRRPRASTTCPKPRRPNERGECPRGYERRLNKHGVPCCYKRRSS